MPTINIEVTESTKQILDREVAAGRFRDSGEFIQTALECWMKNRKNEIEKKLLEADDDERRGDLLPWSRDQFLQAGVDYIRGQATNRVLNDR